ncbi:4-coumarate-CoA ligase 2 [Ophiocordyceps camponoti-floridani]|uniref:4-coumarate-CoA ligase 2 n=1 Tax=Ophiocordyceps camponoti-floridani TaxID=2030778 RepID=A0A8H4QD80_9HYPO|nr:4-coumarate-CoA ligase 2 [Ophiocordyceps camponoti-floridani]
MACLGPVSFRAMASRRLLRQLVSRLVRRSASTTSGAKLLAAKQQTFRIPAQVLIYHAGSGRTAFLGVVRLTSLFVAVFFVFLIGPAYIRAEKDVLSTAAMVAGGIIPLTLVTITSSPFVTQMHMHLPNSARLSRRTLERFVRDLPSETMVTLTTMNFYTAARAARLRAGDLRPAAGTARARLGLVNYVRRRPVAGLRGVNAFFVQPRGKALRPVDGVMRRDLVEGWIWEAVQSRISHSSRR